MMFIFLLSHVIITTTACHFTTPACSLLTYHHHTLAWNAHFSTTASLSRLPLPASLFRGLPFIVHHCLSPSLAHYHAHHHAHHTHHSLPHMPLPACHCSHTLLHHSSHSLCYYFTHTPQHTHTTTLSLLFTTREEARAAPSRADACAMRHYDAAPRRPIRSLVVIDTPLARWWRATCCLYYYLRLLISLSPIILFDICRIICDEILHMSSASHWYTPFRRHCPRLRSSFYAFIQHALLIN